MRAIALIALVSLAACGGEEAAATAETSAVADTALLNADALRIGGFALAAAADEPWREAWQLPAHVSYDPNDAQPLGSLVEGLTDEFKVALVAGVTGFDSRATYNNTMREPSVSVEEGIVSAAGSLELR